MIGFLLKRGGIATHSINYYIPLCLKWTNSPIKCIITHSSKTASECCNLIGWQPWDNFLHSRLEKKLYHSRPVWTSCGCCSRWITYVQVHSQVVWSTCDQREVHLTHNDDWQVSDPELATSNYTFKIMIFIVSIIDLNHGVWYLC